LKKNRETFGSLTISSSSRAVDTMGTQEKPSKETTREVYAKEITLKLVTGMRLAAKCWGPQNGELKVLALHGWLDNAATYDGLGPILASNGIRMVCIDSVGHGRSPHLPPTADYNFLDMVSMVLYAAEALNWPTFHLMGHSLGAAVASIVAGTMPNVVKSLILLDALGPFVSTKSVVRQLQEAYLTKKKAIGRKPKIYPSLDACVKKLMANNQTLAEHSAKAIVKRSTEQVEGGLSFTHDPRLVWERPAFLLKEEDIREILRNINCPVLLIWSSSTLQNFLPARPKKEDEVEEEEENKQQLVTMSPISQSTPSTDSASNDVTSGPVNDQQATHSVSKEKVDNRLEDIRSQREALRKSNTRRKRLQELFEARMHCIHCLSVAVVPGSHHVHLDNAERVAEHILKFLIKPRPKL
jgi:pimeloyl-ACP methyl ester carboxylesterase